MEKKKLIQIGITAILMGILLFAVSNCARKLKAPKSGVKHPAAMPAQNIPPPDTAKADAAGAKPLYQIQEEESRNLQFKRNPFEAPVAQSPKPLSPAASISLTGIVWDKDRPMAIINGKIVKAGDRVAGCNVVEIKETSVLLTDGLKDIEVKLSR